MKPSTNVWQNILYSPVCSIFIGQTYCAVNKGVSVSFQIQNALKQNNVKDKDLNVLSIPWYSFELREFESGHIK